MTATAKARSSAARFALLLGVWLAYSSACSRAGDDRSTAPATAPKPAPASVPAASDDCNSQPAAERLESVATAAVILMLRESDPAGDLAQRQDRVVHDLGPEFQVGRRYAAVAALAGQLTRRGLAIARAHPDVRCVQLDGAGGGTQPLP